MTCPSCGTVNPAGAKFCTECATPLAAGCPSCGTVNPPGAKFCAECGTALQAGARPALMAPATSRPIATELGREPVAERRLVSVLFADLVGFTPFAEERDAEDVRETLTRYFDLAREIIGRYGGTVEKFIGDAVMAVWGAPVAKEDDAERAVRAALEVVDAVRSLAPGVQARAGILTGEAAVTLGATNQGLVAGDLVNTASRLQSAAAPGIVLVDEATQRAASGAIVFEEAGEQSLKGKSAPVTAWRAARVVAERGGRNRSDTLEAPFVGRDEELRQLKDLFHATNREGRARLISVIGPAGIGKTRLAWELSKYIDGLVEPVWWHAGRSPAYGDGVTFWALGEMVRGRAGLVETDDEATTRAHLAEMIEAHVHDPEEARWVEAALLALLGLDTGFPSNQLFAAWRTLFERMAQTSPVVMVFEDFHHADKGLVEFVDTFMEWTRGVPITLVTLARPELLEKRPDWGAGKRSFASIHLEPLTTEAMTQLLAGLVPGLAPSAADAIVSRADGIPLYAVEMVRMLLGQGLLVQDGDVYRPTGPIDDLAVPETLTALIAARLDRLDHADRALVEDAAVLGQSFTVAGLAAVSGTPPETLEGRLASLVRRELLVLDADPRSPERGQYAFVQALIREVAYNTLARKDRKVRHLAAARFFESLGTDELAGGLAGHYLAAQRLSQDEAEADALAAQARVALRGAAERASALGSHDQARMFLDQALEVTTDHGERADLHGRAALEAAQGLDPEIVVRHAAAAVAERRSTGDRAAIASAIATHAQAIATYRGDPSAAAKIVEAAWAEFSDLEGTPAGVDLMVTLARTARGSRGSRRVEGDDSPTSIEWFDRMMPAAERLGLMEPILRGIVGRGNQLASQGRPREGMILLRGGHELAIAAENRDVESQARVLRTFFEQWSDPRAGLALAREGLEISERIGSRGYAFGMVGNAAICGIRAGEWDWVAALLDDWFAIEHALEQFSELHVDRAILRAIRGEDPTPDIDAAAEMRATITDPQFESYEAFARAWAALASGELDVAVREGERAVAVTAFFGPLALPLAARAAVWAKDVDTARRLLRQLEDGVFGGEALSADLATIRAGIAALEGRTADAVVGYREALRQLRSLDLAFDLGLVGIGIATTLAGSERDLPDLVAAMDAAAETLERLGSRPFLERLDAARAASPAASKAAGRTPSTTIQASPR